MNEYGYNPDRDPLIRRVRGRGGRFGWWPFLVIGVLVAWVAYTEFIRPRIAPTGPKLAADSQIIDSAAPGGPSATEAIATDKSAIVLAEQAGQPVQGNYRLGFNAGEPFKFGLSVHIEGKGSPDLAGTNGLNMNFDVDMAVQVLDVVGDVATLQLQADDVNLYGNHFGRRVDMRRAGGVTQDFAAGTPAPVETFMNKRTEEWSIDAFDQPTTLDYDLKGKLVNAESVTRFNRVVLKLLALAGTNFPEGQLHVGDTWAREIDMELFGLPSSTPIIIETTLAGVGDYYGHNCAYLVNTIRPGKSSNPMAKLSHLDVSGQSFAYFSSEIGRIIYGESTLNFDLVLMKGLQEAADLLGVYSGLLDDIEGGENFDLTADHSGGEPLGFRLQSALTMK